MNYQRIPVMQYSSNARPKTDEKMPSVMCFISKNHTTLVDRDKKGLKIFGAAQKKLNLRKVTTKADHFYAYKSGCLFASHIRGYKVWVHRKKTLGILG